jgi:hypothetical protein
MRGPTEPFDDHISNPHRDDFWTCPACYEDLGDVGTGETTCPKCERTIECTVEYEPACHSRLKEGDQDD